MSGRRAGACLRRPRRAASANMPAGPETIEGNPFAAGEFIRILRRSGGRGRQKKPIISCQTPRAPSIMANPEIYLGDNLAVIQGFESGSFDLIYIDPPFNTGKVQSRTRLRTVRDAAGDRAGFQGNRYRTSRLGTSSFHDSFDDFIEFMAPRLHEAHRLLAPAGSFFLHIDYREVHYCKILLDQIFGRACFINEIIWAYDYGARSKKRWSAKHDNILWYARNPAKYTYRFDDIDRIPYLAPGLVGPEKAARGKTPTDTWWHTIVSPTGKEKTGYPTQKPLAILDRIVRVHTNPGDRVLDFFAGSGTTGEAAIGAGRKAVLVDNNPAAIEVMTQRFKLASPAFYSCKDGSAAAVPLAETGNPRIKTGPARQSLPKA